MNRKLTAIVVITLIVGIIFYLLSFKLQTVCELMGGKWNRGPLSDGEPVYEYCYRGDTQSLSDY